MSQRFSALHFSAPRADALVGQIQAALGNGLGGAGRFNTAILLADEACGQALIDRVADWLRQELGSASILPIPVLGRGGAQASIHLLLGWLDPAPQPFGPIDDWAYDALAQHMAVDVPGLCLCQVDPRMPFTAQRLQLMQEGAGGYLCGAVGAPSGPYRGPRGLHLSGLNVAISHTFAGVERLAGDYRITAGQGQVIHEINHQPALDVLKSAAGDILARKPEQIPSFLYAAFPVTEADPDDFLIRQINGIGTTSGTLSVDDDVLPGMPLAFARRNGAHAQAVMTNGIQTALERFGGMPAAALYLHDQARADDFVGDEGAQVREILREIPLITGQVNGLISHNRHYRFAAQLVLFG